MTERMEGYLASLLLLVVLLWVIMPALLYLMGWGVVRYTRKRPAFIEFAVPLKKRGDAPAAEAPARSET